MKRVIGLTGVAGSGKDLFFALLSKRVNVKRFAFADNLKGEVKDFILKQYGIDILNCTRKEKEKLRDFLVFHGTFKRESTKGQHWIKILDRQIKEYLVSGPNARGKFDPDIPVVTDVRYQRYDVDEVTWLKKELGGILVHISQWHTPKRIHFAGEKELLPPANSEEEKEDPKLEGLADYKISWPRVDRDSLENGDIQKSDELNEEVDKFVYWYQNVLV